MNDLVGGLTAAARTAPEQPAHESAGRATSWAALVRAAGRVAAHLARTLPDDGSPVAVLGHKEGEMLAAFLGAAMAGHPYVPLDRSLLPEDRVRVTIAAAGATVTLTPETIAALAEERGDAPRLDPTPETPFYVMFTSGSTGEPKGVTITHGCLAAFLDWMIAEQRLTPGERFLNVAPFSFDLSVMDTFLALATGGTVVCLTRDELGDSRRLYQALAASDVTTWVSTPSFARMCLAERRFGREMLPRLRRFLFCGETLPAEVARQLLERFPETEVWNTYGPTEATVATTSIRVTPAIAERYPTLPIGRAMPGVAVEIMGDDGAESPDGERGQIVIRGPNVSPGYLGRPDLTGRAFFERDGARAYRTGDWGRRRDGLLFFEGRMDDQVKVRGYRIELGDVETHLRALSGVREAVVVPVVRGALESLAAFVVFDPPPADPRATRRPLRAELARRGPE